MRKFTSIVILSLIAISSFSQGWIQKSSIPGHGRRSSLGCSANGKGYYGLGTDSLGVYVAEFWEYDTVHGFWTQLANFPGGGRTGAFGYTIKGKIYVCFGFNNNYICLNDVWEYDPITQIWTQKANFPGQARFNAAGFVINDSLLYIGTGSYNNSNNYLQDFWMYNPTNNSWSQKANFPGGKRMAATAFEVNGMGYLGSGLYDASTPKKDFWKYNPNLDTWSAIPDLPVNGRYGLVSFVLNDKAYVGTGDDYNNSYIDFYKFDPQAFAWSLITPPNTYARFCGIGFTMGNKGYMGFGWNNTTSFSDFWAFDPNITSDINGSELMGSLVIAPNPCRDYFSLSFINEVCSGDKLVTIYNYQGELIKKISIHADKSIVYVHDLTVGIYLLKIESQGSVYYKKLIRN